MALVLSTLTEVLSQEINIEANLVLEIEGIPLIFGATKITRLLRIGDFIIGDGSKIGGIIEDENGRDWIQLSGTTNSVKQKIEPDKASSNSITSFSVNLIDKSDQLSKLFQPGNIVNDILGQEGRVYWSPQGSAHPRDSVEIFNGILSSIVYGAGNILLKVDHPEQLKRTEVLPLVTTNLTADIDSSTLAIPVVSTNGFVSPLDSLQTYIKIDDELCEIDSFTATDITLLSRAQLNTVANAHDSGTEVETFYRLTGGALDLALKILLSDPDNIIFATKTCTAFNQVDALTNIENAVFLKGVDDVETELGLTPGDFIDIVGADNPLNDINDAQIVSFGTNADGSYLIITGTNLVTDIGQDATISFKSRHNTLPFGAKLKPYQVDVAQFDFLSTLFASQLPTYDFYLKDTINIKEFIDTQLLYPAGAFTVPRKGRVSVNKAAPPLADANTKVLNETNITNASKVGVSRSFNERFYNAVQYRFNPDSIEDKFLSGQLYVSADSINRINIGNKVLKIDSDGSRPTSDTLGILETNANRYLDRYQFGAEQIVVKTTFGTGFPIEISDSVILEGEGLKLSDSNSGTRQFTPRVMEVVNKTFSLTKGKIELTLQDTNFSAKARYGTMAPSSIIGTGSTTTEINIVRSFGTEDFQLERDKWEQYIGQKIQVRTDDYSSTETVTLLGFDGGNPNRMLVNPALSSAPSEGHIIDVPYYDDSDSRAMSLYKAIHCFHLPNVSVISGSGADIVVDVLDIDKFIQDYPVNIHSEDYGDTIELNVESIDTGTNTVTFSDTIPFVVDNTYSLDLIGFAGDNGLPYRWF